MENSFKGTDGKMYFLSPLTLGDIKRFAVYVQYREYHKLESLRGVCPDDFFSEQASKIFSKCANTPVSELEVNAQMDTMDGAIYLIWQSLTRNHPTLTVDQVSDLVLPSQCVSIGKTLALLSGVGVGPKVSRSKKN